MQWYWYPMMTRQYYYQPPAPQPTSGVPGVPTAPGVPGPPLPPSPQVQYLRQRLAQAEIEMHNKAAEVWAVVAEPWDPNKWDWWTFQADKQKRRIPLENELRAKEREVSYLRQQLAALTGGR